MIHFCVWQKRSKEIKRIGQVIDWHCFTRVNWSNKESTATIGMTIKDL